MKQYLYNHGDECEWNTGGWIKCKVKKSTDNTSNPTRYGSSVTTVSVLFADEKIVYTCTVSATVGYLPTNQYAPYVRPEYQAIATFGTKSPLTKDISLYKKLKVTDSSKGIVASFRVGAANDGTTQINTATVLQSMTASVEDILMESNHPYLVLGNYYYSAYISSESSFGGISANHNCEITEIYLM